MEFTKELACRIASISFGHLPETAVAAAKVCVADGVGVAIGGSKEQCSTLALRMITTGGPATLLGAGKTASPADAAWFNGIAMHSIDLDDVSATMLAHPSAAILPAALAAAETERASGKSLLLGYILGIEAAATIARLVQPAHHQQGWYATGTIGTVGAAVAAGVIFGLDDEALRNAIGLAVSMASGSRQQFGFMAKQLIAGNAARNGLTAARLAGDGFTADPDAIETPLGFVKLCACGVEPDYIKVMNRFANPFELVSPGLISKLYPCPAVANPAIDAALAIMDEQRLTGDKIKSVEVGVKDMVPNILVNHNPKTGAEAKFSLEYIIAAAIVRGRLSEEEFNEAALKDQAIRAMMKNVSWKKHGIKDKEGEESPFRTAIVKIATKDGKSYEKRVDDPRGSRANPLSYAELLAKFEKCAATLGSEGVRRAWESLAMIEDLKHVQELSEALGTPK